MATRRVHFSQWGTKKEGVHCFIEATVLCSGLRLPRRNTCRTLCRQSVTCPRCLAMMEPTPHGAPKGVMPNA